MEQLIERSYFNWTRSFASAGVISYDTQGLSGFARKVATQAFGYTSRLTQANFIDAPGGTIRLRMGGSADIAATGAPAAALGVAKPVLSGWDVIIRGGLPKKITRLMVWHEIGHALGLEHPHEAGDGDFIGSPDASRSWSTKRTLMAYRFARRIGSKIRWRRADRDALTGLWGRRI